MRDGAGVREVVDTGVLVLGHEDRGREQVVQYGVGVWDVDHALILGDLGDEVAGVEVVADGHAEAENQDIGVCLHDLYYN